MRYRLITVEQDSEGHIEERDRGRLGPTLSKVVRMAQIMNWLPGNISGTGLPIIETRFESVP